LRKCVSNQSHSEYSRKGGGYVRRAAMTPVAMVRTERMENFILM
jgi:hypothetical protein